MGRVVPEHWPERETEPERTRRNGGRVRGTGPSRIGIILSTRCDRAAEGYLSPCGLRVLSVLYVPILSSAYPPLPGLSVLGNMYVYKISGIIIYTLL